MLLGWALGIVGCRDVLLPEYGMPHANFQGKSVEFSATQVSDVGGSWYYGEWVAYDIAIEMEPTDGGSGD